jgi:superfamily II DNA or RNA helicase
MLNLFYGGLALSYGAKRAVVWNVKVVYGRQRGLATVADYTALPQPSAEQELVIKAIRQGRNARVTAVAGSGKTTTILQVAKTFPRRKILGLSRFWNASHHSTVV